MSDAVILRTEDGLPYRLFKDMTVREIVNKWLIKSGSKITTEHSIWEPDVKKECDECGYLHPDLPNRQYYRCYTPSCPACIKDQKDEQR